MSVRKYQAPTMAEALAAVKRDLGRDAVIVQTRSFRKGGLLGLIGGRPVWEVTASPNATVSGQAAQGVYVPMAKSREPAGTAKVGGAQAPQDGPADETYEPLTREVSHLRRLIETLMRHQADDKPDAPRQALPAELREFDRLLHQQEVEDRIAREILRELRMNLTGRQLADRAFIRQRLRDLIMSRLQAETPFSKNHSAERARVIVLIGPTGVGKTTTIAKLAANFKLRHSMRVGLITIDTYRIAAVEQLRTYADIIDVPVRVVLTPEELRQGIYALRGMDVVLIDTAGRSQNDRMRLSQLHRFLESAEADEVHLVVSATASRGCVRGTLQHFAPLGANHVIISKIDEAQTYGTILNVSTAGVGPMSYITTGQEVPDDIAPAEVPQMADWILGGSFHAQ